MPWNPKMVLRPRVRQNTKTGVSRIQRDSYSNTQTDWWTIQHEVIKRDGGKCQKRRQGIICGKKAVTVHHIIPLSRGGLTKKSNLIAICKSCHEITHPHLQRKRSTNG